MRDTEERRALSPTFTSNSLPFHPLSDSASAVQAVPFCTSLRDTEKQQTLRKSNRRFFVRRKALKTRASTPAPILATEKMWV